MKSVARQIIGSFEDIGKEVLREAVTVPKDVAGKALESLGAAPQSPKGQQQAQGGGHAGTQEKGALDTFGKSEGEGAKKAIARAALAELSGEAKKQKEPSLWEQKNMEEEKKKEIQKKQAKEARENNLPNIKSKRRRGDMYGMKGKTGSEVGKNVRQD